MSSDKETTGRYIETQKKEKLVNGDSTETKVNGDSEKVQQSIATTESTEVEVRNGAKGAIHLLGERSTSASKKRSSWASFTSNLASLSVAESVHTHRQLFLQRRAKFNAAETTEPPKSPTKKFEIELRALKLGERSKSFAGGDSWVRYGKGEEGSKPKAASTFTFQRQGSVRDRVKNYMAMTKSPSIDEN